MWIALNGDNRFFSWDEIKRLDPIEQHDFAILSRIYNREAREWSRQKKLEKKQQQEVSEANREMAKQNKWNP